MSHSPLQDDGTTRQTAGPMLDPFASVVVTYDDGPDECTVYPTDVDEEALLTRWVSAEDGSYVRLDEMQ